MAGATVTPAKQAVTAPLQAPGNLSPSNVSSLAPGSYQQFGNIPQLNPTFWNSVNANPFEQQKYLSQYNNMLQSGLQPFFNQQQLSMQQDLASRGITDSSAASYNIGNLQGQQAGVLAQQEAPMVQQAFGYTQQDILANQAAQNASREQNAAVANQVSAANAQYYNQAVTGNMDAYNAFQNSLFGAGTNEQNSLLAAYLNSFGPQSNVGNVMSQGLAGQESAYGNIYSAGLQGQGAAMGGLFGGLGSFFGDSALAGSTAGAGAGAGAGMFML